MRKRTPKRLPRRFPRSVFSLLSLVLALATGYVAGREHIGVDHVEDRHAVFSSFAVLDLDLEGLARMRNSPLPPRNKPARERWSRIVQVMDGDTVRLDDGRVVRLLGIDAPESSENRKLQNDLREMGIRVRPAVLTEMGKAAAIYVKRLAEGRRCWLEYENERKDIYGRALAYVHLDNGVILNESLLADGYAKAYLKTSFKYKKRYVLLQNGARLNRRGLWRMEEVPLKHE